MIYLELPAGKYIIAVSGGVDSVVLLDLLSKQKDLHLVVAHFDHGIRGDSYKDAELVKRLADKYKFEFELGKGNLGPKSSEEKARKVRYAYLEQIKIKYGADNIVTAHHQDDLIETALINMLRGTGRRGISSMLDSPKISRPLLGFTKQQILDYAKKNKLEWSDDPTNKSDDYLRNYLRNNIFKNLTSKKRAELVKNIEKVAKINKTVDEIIATLSHNIVNNGQINRHDFSLLPSEIADELVLYWLRGLGVKHDSKSVKRFSLLIKTAKPGSSLDIDKSLKIHFESNYAKFSSSIPNHLL